jgi:hypothetical protein
MLRPVPFTFCHCPIGSCNTSEILHENSHIARILATLILDCATQDLVSETCEQPKGTTCQCSHSGIWDRHCYVLFFLHVSKSSSFSSFRYFLHERRDVSQFLIYSKRATLEWDVAVKRWEVQHPDAWSTLVDLWRKLALHIMWDGPSRTSFFTSIVSTPFQGKTPESSHGPLHQPT